MTEKKNPGDGGITGDQQSVQDYSHDTALTEALQILEDRDLSVSRRCRVCRHPMTDLVSVVAGIGPKCSRKAVSDDV